MKCALAITAYLIGVFATQSYAYNHGKPGLGRADMTESAVDGVVWPIYWAVMTAHIVDAHLSAEPCECHQPSKRNDSLANSQNNIPNNAPYYPSGNYTCTAHGDDIFCSRTGEGRQR